MRHAYGDAYIHADGNCDSNCHIHTDSYANCDNYRHA
jgi:hypothetical protein